MIPYASAELPALNEAQPPPPRSKGDQPTFLQRVLIPLATIFTMIVIDHGCVSSSPEGHAGFVSEDAFSSSSCLLVTKYFPDQTTVPIGVMTHIARSTCPASTSLPIHPPIFGAAGDSVSYINDLTAPFTAADEIEPIQWLQSMTMRDRVSFIRAVDGNPNAAGPAEVPGGSQARCKSMLSATSCAAPALVRRGLQPPPRRQ